MEIKIYICIDTDMDRSVASAGRNRNTGGRKMFHLGVKVNENRINL